MGTVNRCGGRTADDDDDDDDDDDQLEKTHTTKTHNEDRTNSRS